MLHPSVTCLNMHLAGNQASSMANVQVPGNLPAAAFWCLLLAASLQLEVL